MLLALLSDSHDNAPSIQAALAIFRPHHPAAYLHAGDLVDPAMLAHFAGLAPFHFVFGNNEYDHAALRAVASSLNLHCHGELADLTFAGKRLAMLHGDDDVLFSKLVRSGDYAYVIHGHTHVRHDTRVGNTRIISPGALHRAQPRSVALLDVTTDNLQFLDLPS